MVRKTQRLSKGDELPETMSLLLQVVVFIAHQRTGVLSGEKPPRRLPPL